MTRPATDGDQCAWPPSLSPFYVTDCTSGLRFLVDTGAEVSVIPPSVSDHTHHRNTLTLQAVNNTQMQKNTLTLHMHI